MCSNKNQLYVFKLLYLWNPDPSALHGLLSLCCTSAVHYNHKASSGLHLLLTACVFTQRLLISEHLDRRGHTHGCSCSHVPDMKALMDRAKGSPSNHPQRRSQHKSATVRALVKTRTWTQSSISREHKAATQQNVIKGSDNFLIQVFLIYSSLRDLLKRFHSCYEADQKTRDTRFH